MWNDTEIPLAYLITFRSYGTWLHGDIRGSVNRSKNVYGTPRAGHEPARKDYVRALLNRKPVLLNAQMRHSVAKAIRETCENRGWSCMAINVRTNHIHTVVSTGKLNSKSVLTAFKANATRMMREDGCWASVETPWVEKGSRRYLWNEDSVARAIHYVLFGQGDDLPESF
jgi:REP element-mobilizing transposase RayT